MTLSLPVGDDANALLTRSPLATSTTPTTAMTSLRAKPSSVSYATMIARMTLIRNSVEKL